MKSLLLIDLSGIFWRCWHATADSEVSAAYEQTVAKVHELRHGYDYVAVCCDSPPYKRKELLQSYKANREAAPPLALDQFRRTKERLTADGLLLWEAPGFEADDVIAWACWVATDPKSPGALPATVTVASADKDLMCLVKDSSEFPVTQLHPFDGKRYDRAAVIEKFGVSPEQMGDFLALVGDKSDNIPGVPGVGAVTAAKLLMQFDTLEGVLTHPEDIGGKTAEAIREHANAARLGRKVIALQTDVPLDFGDLFKERKATPLTEPTDWAAEDIDDTEKPEQPAATLARVPQGQALVVARPVEWSMQLEPSRTVEAWKVAKAFHESRLFLKLGGPEAHFMAIMRGRALGLDAATACASFHNIKGRLTLHAEIIIGLVLRSGKAEYFECTETSNERATWVTKRVGARSELAITWDMPRAHAARLVELRGDKYVGISSSGEPSNWDKHRPVMLRWRAGTELAHAVYADVVTGLVTPDEADEE